MDLLAWKCTFTLPKQVKYKINKCEINNKKYYSKQFQKNKDISNAVLYCIYNGVCSSLVALFLWQQVTNLAAVIAHCSISPL
jgi:hypothetical protein